MNSLDGGFGETASSLTFQDPDEDDEVGVDTQADDFRFDFTSTFLVISCWMSRLTTEGFFRF